MLVKGATGGVRLYAKFILMESLNMESLNIKMPLSHSHSFYLRIKFPKCAESSILKCICAFVVDGFSYNSRLDEGNYTLTSNPNLRKRSGIGSNLVLEKQFENIQSLSRTARNTFLCNWQYFHVFQVLSKWFSGTINQHKSIKCVETWTEVKCN